MWEILLFISLLAGQLGRIQITSDIAIYFHDTVIFCYLLLHVQFKKVEFAKALLLVFVVCLVSLIANFSRFELSEIAVGLLYLLRFCMYTSVFFLVLQSKKTQSHWFHWLYFLGVGYAVTGFFQLLLYPNLRNISYLGWDPHYYRLFSTLFDPNFVGGIIVLCLFLGFYLLTITKSKFLVFITQLVLLIALLLTYSRSSFVALIVGLIVYIVLTKKWIYIIFLVLIPLVVLFFPSIGGISTDIGRMWSIIARLDNSKEALNLFIHYPIFGNGFAMQRIDSSILFILVTTGVIGIVAFTNLGIHLIRSGFCITKQPLKAVYFSILTALIIHSIFVNSLFYPQILIWFWIFIGITSRS